jgi:hypothetical protein
MNTKNNRILLRLTRHELSKASEANVRRQMGDDINIITRDIKRGEDPLDIIKELDPLWVDCVMPLEKLQGIMESTRPPLKFITAVYSRDEQGRVLSTEKDAQGRDIFEVEKYEWLQYVEIRTAPLEQKWASNPMDLFSGGEYIADLKVGEKAIDNMGNEWKVTNVDKSREYDEYTHSPDADPREFGKTSILVRTDELYKVELYFRMVTHPRGYELTF